MIDCYECQINCKGFGRKRSWFHRDTIPEFAWRAWRNSRKILRVASVSVEIRTENILNTRLERYCSDFLMFIYSLRPRRSSCLGYSVPLPPQFLQNDVLWFLTHVSRVLINRFNTRLFTLLGWKLIFHTYLWIRNNVFHPKFWKKKKKKRQREEKVERGGNLRQ
jgi:hypothetical protein